MNEKEIKKTLDQFAELCGKAMPIIWRIENRQDFEAIQKIKGKKKKYRLIQLDFQDDGFDCLA